MQEERSVFWEVTLAVIVRTKIHLNMCIILKFAEIQQFESTNTRALWMVMKVKVKVTLEQATKAQKGCRGIALLFL